MFCRLQKDITIVAASRRVSIGADSGRRGCLCGGFFPRYAVAMMPTTIATAPPRRAPGLVTPFRSNIGLIVLAYALAGNDPSAVSTS